MLSTALILTNQKKKKKEKTKLVIDKSKKLERQKSPKKIQRTEPPENGEWTMPLLGGDYFKVTFENGEKHGPVSRWTKDNICTMETYHSHGIMHGP